MSLGATEHHKLLGRVTKTQFSDRVALHLPAQRSGTTGGDRAPAWVSVHVCPFSPVKVRDV